MNVDVFLHEPPPQSTQWQARTYEKNDIIAEEKKIKQKIEIPMVYIFELPSNIDSLDFFAFSGAGAGALEQE